MALHSSRGVIARMILCWLLLGMLGGPACAQTFPANGWLPLTQQGLIFGDPADATLVSQKLDVVGDKSNPAAFVTSDASYLYFRMLVAANPYNSSRGKFAAYSWTCLLDVDSQPQTY